MKEIKPDTAEIVVIIGMLNRKIVKRVIIIMLAMMEECYGELIF